MLMSCCPLVAVVIGEGSLPIRCAELLLNRGWSIKAVLSVDPTVVNWAKEKGLTGFWVKRSAELQDCLGELEFDCLFSVVNSLLLPTEIIQLARRRAVNYHDAPLFKYGGLNAATWALISGETSHGISWHELTAGVDEGNLLVQVPVAIAEDETSLTLNVKCYEAALSGFDTLVEQLEKGQEIATLQDLSQRPYFAGWARPWAGGLLDFSQSADRLSCLVRGLSFGPGYFNSMTLPKLWLGRSVDGLLGHRWVTVQQLSVTPTRHEAPSGQVLAIEPEQILISTATEDVRLSGFQNPKGDRVLPGSLGLSVGQQLPQLTQPSTLQSIHETVARHETFWRRRLKVVESFKLTWMESHPTENRDPWEQATQTWALSDELCQGLTALARPHCTEDQSEQLAFALGLTTALGSYLARLSDEGYGDLAFSGPVQQQIISQADAALAPSSGLFSTYVPMQVRPDLDASVMAALATLAKEQVVLDKRGVYATELLLRDPELAVVQPLPIAVTWGTIHSDCSLDPSGHLLLNLVIDGQQCHWQYNHSRLTRTAVEYFATQLESFIAGLIKQPQQPLRYQPLVSAEERQRVTQSWNQTQADYDWHCCVHNLFETQVETHPERIALEFEQQRLTYDELNRQANQIAHLLIQQGVKTNDRVGIHVDRSLEMIVALWGVLKAGGAYLPLDPSYPRDRLALMVEDAEPKVLLTQRALQGNLSHDCELCLDEAELWANQPQTNPEVEVSPGHLAYIIYTSGSTGRPKGVMIEHGSLTNLSKAVTHDYHISEDVVLEFASISFDMAVEEIYPCLLSGGRLIIRTQEMIQSVQGFLAECESRGVTVLSLPTAYWHLIVAELNADHSLRMPEAVRVVLIGGEAASPRRVVQWQQMCHRTGFRTSLLNTYGPTEGTVDSTFYQFELPSLAALDGPVPTSVPIGYPIRNVTNYVLDSHQQPVPVGCVGELCVGGAGVARGYLHRPDLTAERFISDPFSELPGAKLYRTGDLVRHRTDGAIEYLGRLDHQVKIRGFRIELGEIESLLVQQASVEDAVVIAWEDQPGRKRLVAYVVAKEGIELKPEQLHQALSEKLPDYMVPVAFIGLVELPMTPNEKVDRKALPVPDLASLGSRRQASGFVKPKTEAEKLLARLWENMFGVAPIGCNDNFLELGGDSLSAMRLCTQIEREFGHQLLLSTLFQAPCLGELADILQGDRVMTQSSVLPLKSQGYKPPLFFVNCAQDANQVANYLGEDYRVYGLNLFGATERLFNRLDQFEMRSMAQIFAEDIRQIQPQGPYYLSSYCGDTRLAVELAQEFQRQGDKVALLALIDPWWNDAPPTLAYHWQTLRHFGWSYGADKLKEKTNALRVKGSVLRDRWNARLRRLSQQGLSNVDRDVQLYEVYQKASAAFQPSPYEGYTVLMFSEELQIDKTGELDDVLANFAACGYEMRSIPGYHHALFYPESLDILGKHLRWAIDSAQERSQLSSESILETI